MDRYFEFVSQTCSVCQELFFKVFVTLPQGRLDLVKSPLPSPLFQSHRETCCGQLPAFGVAQETQVGSFSPQSGYSISTLFFPAKGCCYDPFHHLG